MMPRMTGHEFCRRARADRRLAGVPVILAGSADAAARDSPADALIRKPFDLDEFERIVRQILARPRKRRR
jgi:CheY-like chemotaxis protein